MIKRILSLVLALLLMATFYVYALLRENEETRRSDRWVVAEEDTGLQAFGGMQSTDPAALAKALGSTVPLPEMLLSGTVQDARYHGYYVRTLAASDGRASVRGVRPASASPLIRQNGLRFSSSEKTLLGYPLLEAQDGQHVYYYLVSDLAAFVLQLPLDQASLQGFVISQPE